MTVFTNNADAIASVSTPSLGMRNTPKNTSG